VSEDLNQPTFISGNHRVIAGRYVLEKEIGRGGMGTVWRASQLGVGNVVAIKFLSDQLSANEGLVRRFEQEAKVSLEVTHPGAAQLLDTGRDPKTGQLFIVFEYVEGEDLRARLSRDGALPFEEARDIALRVAEVLAAAHSRGVVHRDIKPENIRVRRDLGTTWVKVLDFGIDRFRPEVNEKLTAEGAIAGTPGYMAPEQVCAELVDGRSDLYALGLVTWEMMTGRAAFTSKAPAALLVDQLTTPLPLLQVAAPQRDFPELDAVLQTACAKEPDARYQTAKDFIAALKGVRTPPWSSRFGVPAAKREDRATPAAPLAELSVRRATQASKVERSPWPLVAVVLVVLSVLGGLGAAMRNRAGAATGTACPGSELYLPEVRDTPTAQLEARVAKSRLMPPSAQRKQLETLQATARGYAEDKRDCMYRLMLMAAVTSEQTVFSTTPELWGQTREVDQLRLLFLELPLRQRWTLKQRRDVLEQIDTLMIANLTKNGEGDEDHWRRQYYGIEVACEVTDEALEHLKTRRPSSCLNLSPRNP